MQNFWGEKCKITFLGEKLIINENFSMSFHCTCDLHHGRSRKAIKHFEFYGIWRFYKILKICIFGKLTGGFENFL